jgi:hypothetical protein
MSGKGNWYSSMELNETLARLPEQDKNLLKKGDYLVLHLDYLLSDRLDL